MNCFADQPILTELVLPSTWTDPFSGIIVPKNPTQNLEWRAKLLTEAENDRDLQVDLYTAASQSLLFWVNTFVFTLRVFEADADGIVRQASNPNEPFVTWPIQDRHLLRIEHAVDEGTELLTDKSRDMGATWDHISVLTHRFLFRMGESHLIISRKEDAVDQLDGYPRDYPWGMLSDPGTLFGKVDYILNRLPEWMVPGITRKKMHLINHENRSRIDGESSNATAGASDRRTSIFLDEFAKVDEAESIKRGTKDVTACRLVCSTPNGPGTVFSKWRMSGAIPVFEMPWWEHPEKGLGRYAFKDVGNKWKVKSPWYDMQVAQRSPKEVAIELDMDHVGSGDSFFEAAVIDKCVKTMVRVPKRRIDVRFRRKIAEDKIAGAAQRMDREAVFAGGSGPWKIWCDLPNKGRPDQTKTYIIGVDISKGQGASNSVMSCLCNETKEKIAEFADPNVAPFELAKLAVAFAIWVGGRTRPLIIWENNGDPGFDFGRQLVHTYRYPHVYFDRQSGTISEKVGKRYGWRSTPEKKAAALGLLRRAYSLGRFKNPSEAALNECLLYIYYESGGIGPSELVNESDSARKAHGDRVIADMLTLVGGHDYQLKKLVPVAPERSFKARFDNWKRERKFEKENLKHPKRFNFSEAHLV